MVPSDCSGGRWKAAFDSLSQCIEFFVDDTTTRTTTSTTNSIATTSTTSGAAENQNPSTQDFVEEMKAELEELADETKVNIYIGVAVIV